ncbi:MAG: hypothetical protein P9L99_13225 [Candidatus Lernaella stagnicola]|nr:hypothetical protein [Candidatus Lernaella stagnicola]
MLSKRHTWLIVAVALMAVFTMALAHAAKMKVAIDGKTVRVAACYNDGSPMKKTNLKIVDIHGKTMVRGVTDDKGEFAFEVEGSPYGVKIVIQDLLGHRCEYTLTPDDAKTQE